MSKYNLDRVADNLNISLTALQEIKYRLGIKKNMTEDEYKLISKVVCEIREYFGKVTTSLIYAYWLNYGDKWKNAWRTEDE